MCRKCFAVVGALSLLVVLASSAQAGFVNIGVSSPDASANFAVTALNTSVDPDLPYDAEVGVHEVFEEGREAFGLDVAGATDEDPVMQITKVVENQSGFDWIGYEIDLTGFGGATFVGAPVSGSFDLVGMTASSLDFGNGVLPSGNSATFVFDVNIPTVGDFSFGLNQSPILVPEPSTILMALLMAGGSAMVALRRRWG